MEEPKKPTSRRTSIYRRDFVGIVETLKMRVRFKLECHKTPKRPKETVEQLQWALQELDRIAVHYQQKLPWPAGALAWVLKDSWPPESDLRTDLSKLEKEYYEYVTKPPK